MADYVALDKLALDNAEDFMEKRKVFSKYGSHWPATTAEQRRSKLAGEYDQDWEVVQTVSSERLLRCRSGRGLGGTRGTSCGYRRPSFEDDR
jgi:hypothetical protein